MSLLNRASLLKLSDARARDAGVLLSKARYGGAYYLAGYAVECALKARIAQNTRRNDFPDKKFVDDSYTHDLDKLFGLAELKIKRDEAMETNEQLEQYWLVAKDWSEASRYNSDTTRQAAEDLIEAITNPTDGILQWIEKN